MVTGLPECYHPTGEILKGGMGEIIICRDKNLDRKVAIKFLLNEFNRSSLTDEIKALSHLRSKHVVQIFDLVLDDDRRPGIVQEYIEGEDLSTKIESQTLSKDKYLKILYQIISGISDIHQEGLIHRDIKPNNIKFDQANLIKIFDFGLTRIEHQNNSTMGFKGTTMFAAPELYSDGFVHFTKAIDIYAFGATARYISGAEMGKEFYAIPPENNPKPSFRHISIDLPDDVIRILDQTLEFKPENRSKAGEIKQVIEKYLLFERHRALLTSDGRSEIISQERKSVHLNIPKVGSLTIRYDGLNFLIAHLNGRITVNRQSIKVGQSLPNNCVITFEGDGSRTFITFDISNPEVVL